MMNTTLDLSHVEQIFQCLLLTMLICGNAGCAYLALRASRSGKRRLFLRETRNLFVLSFCSFALLFFTSRVLWTDTSATQGKDTSKVVVDERRSVKEFAVVDPNGRATTAKRNFVANCAFGKSIDFGTSSISASTSSPTDALSLFYPSRPLLPLARDVAAKEVPVSYGTGGLGFEEPTSMLEALDLELQNVVANVRNCVLRVEARPNDPHKMSNKKIMGCGFPIQYKDRLFLVTNAHLVHEVEHSEIDVYLPNGDKVVPIASFVCDDFDLAALELNPNQLPQDGAIALPSLGTSETLRVGASVVAVGAPFGLDKNATYGRVCALRRNADDVATIAKYSGNTNDLAEYIQTDAAVSCGNSGGPLCNARGEVVGIVSFILAPAKQGSSTAFALPIDVALRVLRGTIDRGRWTRSRLGVEIARAEMSDLVGLGAPFPYGVKIIEVRQDSPAELSGTQKGDVVLSCNGNVVNDERDFRRAIALSDVQDKITLGIWRDMKYLEVETNVVSFEE